MKKAVLVFSGYNQRAVTAFLRTLEKTSTPYGIIACSKSDPIFLSAYKSRVTAVRKKARLEIKDMIQSIKKAQKKIGAGRYVIAPSTEALNRFLLENRRVFEGNNCEIPLVGKAAYEFISDKLKFCRICSKNGILVPAEHDDIKKIKIPYVAKPKAYFTAKGRQHNPILVFDAKSHAEFLKKYDPNDFFFQQHVGGRSIYLLYYFSRSGRIYKFSQENMIQQAGGKSIIAAVSSAYHKCAESGKYEKLFRKTGFAGLVMVEMKKSGKKFYMIEANPRFWGPSQLFVDAGCNFFEAFLNDCGLPVNKPVFRNKKGTRYFWFGGMAQAVQKRENVVFHAYDRDKFAAEYGEWLGADVYNREDTAGIFFSETGAGREHGR